MCEIVAGVVLKSLPLEFNVNFFNKFMGLLDCDYNMIIKSKCNFLVLHRQPII